MGLFNIDEFDTETEAIERIKYLKKFKTLWEIEKLPEKPSKKYGHYWVIWSEKI